MFTVRSAEPGDVAAMAELFREMDEFYGETITEPATTKIDQINSVLFADPPLAYAILAWDGSNLVGMAAYSFLWPAALTTKSLYLKELYVSKSYRRHGIGKLLMEHVFKAAIDTDCSRVEWTTDDNTTEAQRFYRKLGFPANSSKTFYRVEGGELLSSLSSPSTT
jgi:ribosomal protein S18 acetylase RimI-like enzyme